MWLKRVREKEREGNEVNCAASLLVMTGKHKALAGKGGREPTFGWFVLCVCVHVPELLRLLFI